MLGVFAVSSSFEVVSLLFDCLWRFEQTGVRSRERGAGGVKAPESVV